MKHKIITFIIVTMTAMNNTNAQQLDFTKVKNYEHLLDDVMELTDTTVIKAKLSEIEEDYRKDPNEINNARLGIIYHETALNLSFFSKTTYKGYAQKSFDMLSHLSLSPNTPNELMPFVASYRASALSLVGAETKKLKLLEEAFLLFSDAIKKYGDVSYMPEFLRGSVAENLPWFFLSKRKLAKQDFHSIIQKQTKDEAFANNKIMSFTYWAWAKQHQGKKYRDLTLRYLKKSIELDADYKAGRAKAEALLLKLNNHH
jgi:hypothetical protein